MAPVAVTNTTERPTAAEGHASPTATSGHAFTLDYAEWTGPQATPKSQAHFLNQLRQACAGLGFFYLTNTPLDEGSLRSDIFALNRAFFRLLLDVRQRISIVNSSHFRGFSKFGDERTQSLVDHRDQIDYGLEEVEPGFDQDTLQAFPFLHLLGPNQFLPDDVLPNHRALVLQWLKESQAVTIALTEALEAALGARKGGLSEFLTGTGAAAPGGQNAQPRLYARMKTIRYPRSPIIDGVARLQESTQGVGAHKDGGWITILATSPHRGLQVQSLDGRWLDVEHHPKAMVINFGQQIERMSRGTINAATHRVLSHANEAGTSGAGQTDGDGSDGDRYSVAFFSMPALNVVVQPLPSSSLSPEFLRIWERAQEERKKATGSSEVVTVVPKGDLWGADDAPFGFQAWRGIVRSHSNVVERYGYTA